MPRHKAVIVAISGCSCSGKTTLSRLLRDILPNTFILHEDDFYRAEADIPLKDGLADWDCAGSLEITRMEQSLTYIQSNGRFPPNLNSIEDQNSVGECPVPAILIESLKNKIQQWTSPSQPGAALLAHDAPRVCLFDGFLLYPPSMSCIQPYLDIKMFLRVSYAKAKQRREARIGYVTVDGFWQDPEGYVDKIVWPNYVAEHAVLFEGGNVELSLKEHVSAGDSGVKSMDSCDQDMGAMLSWAVDLLMSELPKLLS